MPTTAVPTLGALIESARTILQDKLPTSGNTLRYSDDELFECLNTFMLEVRTKRPDLFLPLGLRTPVLVYSAESDMNTPFPLDTSVWSAFVYYIVGRTELREDTFSEDSRATAMMNKAVSQLLTVQS
jgi:hypothetical protein